MSGNEEIEEIEVEGSETVAIIPFRLDALPVAVDYIKEKQYLYVQAKEYLKTLMRGYNTTGVMHHDFNPTVRLMKDILESLGVDVGDERKQLGNELVSALVKTVKLHPEVMKEIKENAADAARKYMSSRQG